MEIIKSGLTALVASLFCIWLLRPLAIRIGLVDRPNNDRKWHEREVPLIGGIAIFFGFCFALLTLPVSLQPYRSMLGGSSILVLMGVIDDFKDLSSKLRLLGQIFAAFLLVSWGHVILSDLGNILFIGDLKLGWVALPLTMLMVVTYINAMNMVDGQDGLAGGVAMGQAILLLILSLHLHNADRNLLITLIGSLIGFLSFNMRLPWRKRASIFMGDAGSTFIAFLLAWVAIDLAQDNQAIVKPITVLWIMAFPIYDLINVIVLRIRQQKPILAASRDHIHHVLHVAGVNASLSTLLLCAVSVSLGLLGFLFNYLIMPESWQFLLWMIGLVFYIFIVELARKPLLQEDPLPDT